jgi:hypothetical protein
LSVEVGFSPADILNANITSSLVYSIDQLIGNPALRYSSSYDSLDTYRNNYFSSSYDKPHSIAEYVRLIKFYNNSLFKMIKDFVPARTNISTGIIVKPHVLERNKYARNEPRVETYRYYSQSIDMTYITGSAATSYIWPTTKNREITSSLGYITVPDSYGFENYTGEFQGTTLVATSLNSVGDQTVLSQNSMLSSSRVNFGALYQNVTGSVRSQRRLDLDYTNNSRVPINFGIVTKSIKDSARDNFATYTNPMSPYAELQDYNYNIQRSTIPRYYGSKTTSLKYNEYTSPSSIWQGDSSYGNTAAIDHNSFKVGWVKNIPTKALNFPDKTTIYLKYLIDSSQNITDLSLKNNNLFEVQNTFKTGDSVVLSVSDVNKPSNQKTLDGNKLIFKGGFSYDPIFYKEGFNDDLRFIYADNTYFKKTENAEGFYVQSTRGNLALTSGSIAYLDWTRYGLPGKSPTDPDSMTHQQYLYINRSVNTSNSSNFTALFFASQSLLPISDFSYSYNEWQALYPSTNDINFTLPTTNPYNYFNGTAPLGVPAATWNGWKRVFRIPTQLNDFTNGLSVLNEEPGIDVTGNGQYLYKAQYGATYLINSIVNVNLEFLNYPFATIPPNSPNATVNSIINQKETIGDVVKLVGLLEKSSDEGVTWTTVGSTKIDSVTGPGAGAWDSTTNSVSILRGTNANISPIASAVLKLKSANSSIISVPLIQGDILRFNIFILDCSAAFKTCREWYISTGPTSVKQDLPSTNVDSFGGYHRMQIRNPSVPFFNYITEITIPKSSTGLISVSGSVIKFTNKDLCDLYYSSSYFNPLPESSTSINYSPVIDTFTPQPGDLVRFGSFSSPQITEYYTITSISSTCS